MKSCFLSLVTVIFYFATGLVLAADGPIILQDVTKQTGITFRHTDGGSGQHYIAETVASGLATFDYDGDGLIDIYFLTGRRLPGPPWNDSARNALYRNLGNFRFVDVTEQAGVDGVGYGLGVAIADYDSDGYPDIYCNNFGPNVLYRNNGDGSFTDVTAEAGVARGQVLGAGANFLDIEGDGDLDLFVANYLDFSYENHRTANIRGRSSYAGPRDYPPKANRLFQSNGDGSFTDISVASGIAAHPGSGMGTICLDYDKNGRTDIFVCNDQRWDFLFRNEGGGKFEECGLIAGVACNVNGVPTGSMGADAGDYLNEGWLSLLVTDYQHESSILHRNLGGGQFEDVAFQAGLGVGAMAYVKWGCGLVDFDNDCFKDILIGCGHIYKDIDAMTDRTSYEVRPVLFRNLGNETFANVSDTSGDGMMLKMVARGIAFDDLDNDGRVDVVVLNRDRPPSVLRNQSATGGHWLQLRLIGANSNRDGVGAQVTVTAGEVTQLAEVHSGRGYQSHFGSRLHFGLGQQERVDRIEVRWIGGGLELREDVAVDRLITLFEETSPVPQGNPKSR
ncbi:MAG: CRTAC1 family protein [Pirellulaceae bacterium]